MLEVIYHNNTKNISYKKGNRRVLERYFIEKLVVGHFIYLHDVSYKIISITSVDLYESVIKFNLVEEKEKWN